MVSLNDLLVCAVCHSELLLNGAEKDGRAECPECSRSYEHSAGVYNMTPLPLPDEELKSKWVAWQSLQDNGWLFYIREPELNLSIGPREDAQAFKAFAQSSGLVLDIGCGPQARPSYLPVNTEVIGIDPLLGDQPREFSFVQGIGEYLPFRNAIFDHILYASSLDHLINPRRSLAEAARCLKPCGRMSLWIDGLDSNESTAKRSRRQHYQALVKKGFKRVSRQGWSGLRLVPFYIASVANMKIPAGASDYFHFTHLSLAVVSSWLNAVNLKTVRLQEYPEADSVFIQVKREAPAENGSTQRRGDCNQGDIG
jgi:SAM-dependent methyltransferase